MGSLIVFFCWACFLFVGEYFTQGNAHIYGKALRCNCTQTARLLNSEYDEGHGLWTVTYEYEFRGVGYTYTKNFWGEEPPDTINLFWDPKHPSKPMEVSDVNTEKNWRELLLVVVFGSIAAGVGAIFLPQLPLIFVGVVVMGIMLRHSIPGKLVICGGLLCVFLSGMMWLAANVDSYTWRYDDYESIKGRLEVIDTLEPVEIARLYQDWSWLMEGVHEAHDIARIPVFGQYADRTYRSMEEIPWPTAYARYHDYKYRDALLYPDD